MLSADPVQFAEVLRLKTLLQQTAPLNLPARVLHVLNSAAGGAALSTIALIKAFSEEGVSSCAFCHDDGTAIERGMLADAVQGRVAFARLYWWNRKTRQPLWKRPLSELKQWLTTAGGWRGTNQVARFATTHAVDLIHTNTSLNLEGGRASRRLGIPHVWHLRESVGPGNLVRFPLEGPAYGRFVAKLCDKMVANSHSSAAQIQSWLPPGLLTIVPNGIDLSRFIVRPADKSRRPLVIGMVGNLTSKFKKHAMLIEAAAALRDTPDLQFRIYGHDCSKAAGGPGDDYADSLHKMVDDRGLTDRFQFAGFVAQPEAIMAELDILVHPIETESFGRVIVEAMAAGLPVVGAQGGGVAEIVVPESTGLLFAPNDQQALNAALRRLVANSDLRFSMGSNGRARAEQLYSLQACVAGVRAAYAEAMRTVRT